jgi:hypothetical protein
MSEVQKQMTLQPEYIENFLKDLLANIYQVQRDDDGNVVLDEAGNPIVTGIAAQSPLYGEPQFDEDGNPIYQKDADGNVITDQYGNPIQEVIGGVAAPDIIGLQIHSLEQWRCWVEDMMKMEILFPEQRELVSINLIWTKLKRLWILV